MPLTVSDLKLFGSASMPDSNTPTNIGGAIATAKKPVFEDVSGAIQAVSSAAGDTTQTVTVHYRDSGGSLQSQVVTLNGTTAVAYATSVTRLEKALKSGSTTGAVAVEAQTAERADTAQAGGANTITLDAAASAVDDAYNARIIRITGGTGAGQIREIYDYIGATKIAHVSYPWATVPDATSVFRISKGFFFDKNPSEATEVRRVFYDAAANAPGGGAVAYYDKVFYQNSSSGLSLLGAQVVLLSDPTSRVSFGLAATINDTGGNGGGNNRTVAPAGITFGTSPVAVPGTDLMAGSSIGIWLKAGLLDGDTAQAGTLVLRLTGTTAA
jgi:hypothetical protein